MPPAIRILSDYMQKNSWNSYIKQRICSTGELVTDQLLGKWWEEIQKRSTQPIYLFNS